MLKTRAGHEPAVPQNASDAVVVVGLGYVGMVLAAALAKSGIGVCGIERRAAVRDAVLRGDAPFHEKDLAKFIGATIGTKLFVMEQLPDVLTGTIILCPGTPIDGAQRPDLRDLERLTAQVAERAGDDLLVIVRSTVPVGTCRKRLAPILARSRTNPQLAYCPERTIQGKAIREVRCLPQIVAGVDERSRSRAAALFSSFCERIVLVSSLEIGEFVKLINNCHTDVIYGYGNEVAAMAERLDLDAKEAITAANLNYPRPDIAMPGFVGGGCLSKDLFHLLGSFDGDPPELNIIPGARQTNAMLPELTVRRLLAVVRDSDRQAEDCVFLLSGFAYKGDPETDDVRGSPALPIVRALREVNARVLGHDFVVPRRGIADAGAEPVDWIDGVRQADVLVLLNNHPLYRDLEIGDVIAEPGRPFLIYDVWGVVAPIARMFPSRTKYLRFGDGRAA